MDREQQRRIGSLVVGAAKSIEEGLSTLPATIWADEIEMEWFTLEGGELLRDYPAETRRRMAREGRAMEDGSYPIADCSDAENAIRSVGRAKPAKRAAVKAFIKRRVRALGCKGKVFEPYQ